MAQLVFEMAILVTLLKGQILKILPGFLVFMWNSFTVIKY